LHPPNRSNKGIAPAFLSGHEQQRSSGMRQALLAAAALVAATAISTGTAGAQAFTGSSFSAPMSSGWVHESAPPPGSGDFHRGDHGFGGNIGCGGGSWGGGRHMHRGGGSGCAIYGGWGYVPDVNRDWSSDSFNDWWHDRPDRAYPRWVQHNEGCTPDRMWWHGSVLAC
jgi:hypothetical protein